MNFLVSGFGIALIILALAMLTGVLDIFGKKSREFGLVRLARPRKVVLPKIYGSKIFTVKVGFFCMGHFLIELRDMGKPIGIMIPLPLTNSKDSDEADLDPELMAPVDIFREFIRDPNVVYRINLTKSQATILPVNIQSFTQMMQKTGGSLQGVVELVHARDKLRPSDVERSLTGDQVREKLGDVLAKINQPKRGEKG